MNILVCISHVPDTTSKIDAINEKEKIGIFGDYDVDGATSTALSGKYLTELNPKII